MKIDLPATLNSFVEAVYPEKMNWADMSIHPKHYVVVRFGDIEVARVPLTPEQEQRIDYHAQYNDEVMEDIAVEVTAGMLRKMWVT